MIGNELWWDQVRDVMKTTKSPYKEAEMEVFRELYHRMKRDGLAQDAIRAHFKASFDIGYSAFYTRLRRI